MCNTYYVIDIGGGFLGCTKNKMTVSLGERADVPKDNDRT